RPAPAPRPRPVHRKARVLDLVAATVLHPSLELHLPGDASDAMVQGLVDMALERPSTHLDVLSDTVVECGQPCRGYNLPAHLDGRLLAEAWRIGVRNVGWLPDDRNLRAYLRTHSALARWGVDSAAHLRGL